MLQSMRRMYEEADGPTLTVENFDIKYPDHKQKWDFKDIIRSTKNSFTIKPYSDRLDSFT